MKKSCFLVVLYLVALFVSSCDNKIAIQPAEVETGRLESSIFKGSGSFTYDDYAPLTNKPIEVFYHIPENATSSTPILIVYHGTGRDGENNRNLLVQESNAFGFIVLVPEFSSQYFPGGDEYNLGNIFTDGDNPSTGSLNPEEEWAFSLVDPLFDYFTDNIKSSVEKYDIFGFSGGGQFAHRHFMFKPNDKYNRVIAASSGWYTVLDNTINFPYGTKSSPIEITNYSSLLAKSLTILIGSSDNDPNSGGLRHNDWADAQGLHRLDRAYHFFNECQRVAIEQDVAFSWGIQTLPNVGHNFDATSSAAAVLLYK
jgi:predicted esterase